MTAPRQLLGWTVPEHVSWIETDGYVEITCTLGGTDKASTTTSVQNREWIGEFLTKHAHGATVERLEGVLPETPEPSTIPAEIYSAHQYNARQMRDPDQLDDLCTCGEWVRDRDWAQHHAEEAAKLAIPAPQSSPAPLLPVSAPVETRGEVEGRTEALSPQSETELKLWNLLDKAEQEYLASDEPCDRKSALVRAVLAEGWRPPQPAALRPGDSVDVPADPGTGEA